ncbi:YfcE family phosphodiesterase [Treponema parvum]|uniref:YfcE family phosphodiesterase n=1 Tax=Treponema parvum TaxID=138851 RepID=UPI001AEBFB5B|nr:YfcE family phosphodiesterase [Treponema parvum]QTQ15601.1 YfcE family phosphodiesterase [Treponema parvum]
MNKLVQLRSKLIGSDEDALKLSEADSADILVISDSHGNKNILFEILSSFGKGSDALVFCGDGAGDVAFMLDRASMDIAFSEYIPPVVAVVRGNNDGGCFSVQFASGAGRFEAESEYERSVIPDSLVLPVCLHKIFITHGHRYYSAENLYYAAKKAGAYAALYGHTHIACKIERKGAVLVNPGSCSFPRGGMPPSFARIFVRKNREDIEVVFYKIEIYGGKLRYVPFEPRFNFY